MGKLKIFQIVSEFEFWQPLWIIDVIGIHLASLGRLGHLGLLVGIHLACFGCWGAVCTMGTFDAVYVGAWFDIGVQFVPWACLTQSTWVLGLTFRWAYSADNKRDGD